MNTTLQVFVSKLTDDVKKQIIIDYELYEHVGHTGDTEIRRQTEKSMAEVGLVANQVSIWMTYVAMECYKHFSTLYFASLVADKAQRSQKQRKHQNCPTCRCLDKG